MGPIVLKYWLKHTGLDGSTHYSGVMNDGTTVYTGALVSEISSTGEFWTVDDAQYKLLGWSNQSD